MVIIARRCNNSDCSPVRFTGQADGSLTNTGAFRRVLATVRVRGRTAALRRLLGDITLPPKPTATRRVLAGFRVAKVDVRLSSMCCREILRTCA